MLFYTLAAIVKMLLYQFKERLKKSYEVTAGSVVTRDDILTHLDDSDITTQLLGRAMTMAFPVGVKVHRVKGTK